MHDIGHDLAPGVSLSREGLSTPPGFCSVSLSIKTFISLKTQPLYLNLESLTLLLKSCIPLSAPRKSPLSSGVSGSGNETNTLHGCMWTSGCAMEMQFNLSQPVGIIRITRYKADHRICKLTNRNCIGCNDTVGLTQARPNKACGCCWPSNWALSPSAYSAVSSAVQSTKVLQSQSRQLKIVGEKIFPCFAQTNCHYAPLHTGDFLVQYFRDAF